MSATVEAYEKVLRIVDVVANRESHSAETRSALMTVKNGIKTLLYSTSFDVPKQEKKTVTPLPAPAPIRRPPPPTFNIKVPTPKPPVPPKPKVNIAIRNAQIVEDFKAGMLNKQIAHKHGITPGLVAVVLSAARKRGEVGYAADRKAKA